MLGPFRRFEVPIALGLALFVMPTAEAQKPTPNPPAADSAAKLPAAQYALPGEEPPKAFVPAHPRTVEEQKKVESLRYYAVARALEERRQFGEAVKSLEKALEGDPKSTTILHRLSRINFGLGNVDKGIAFGRRVLEIDPGDIETIEMLIRNFRNDPAAAETLLNDLAKNPKLVKNSAGALYIEYELGNSYEGSLQFDKAADSFAKVVEALDDNSNVRLNPAELRRFLGTDEAQAYLRFGRVFLLANRTDAAIKAFRRGLVYDPEEPAILYLMSKTYLAAGKPEEALGSLERFLKKQPVGREYYDQLAKILTALKREAEIIPRLEKYAAADPKNMPLQYALAERYRLTGQVAKAQALFTALMAEQRDTHDFAEQFPKLLKERKSEELLQLLTRAFARFKRFDAVQAQIEMLVADPAYTDEVLDSGMKMLASNPPALDLLEGCSVLRKICYDGKRYEKLAGLLRWSIKRLPNPFTLYQELIITDYQLGKYDDAELVWKEMIEKFPDERSAKLVALLGEVQAKAGKNDEAIATYREALRLDANDGEVMGKLANLLIETGKADEAIATVRDAAKADPNNYNTGFVLGIVLSRAKRTDEAIAQLKNVIERFPENEDLFRRAHGMLSVIYSDINDFAKAEAELEVVLAKYPEDATVNNDLGYLYADQGKNLDKAEAMIRKALAEEPDNYAFLDSLGWVLFKRGKFEEALVPLEKALADSLSDVTIPDHLGDVYFQLQETSKAKTVWEKALKMAAEAKPVDKRYAEIQKKIQSLQQFVPAPKAKTGDKP
jgi:tetratricopeptide (TPR) repeat protein